jgi:NNP family nitrate/nitrite transporter-like MFS transporter
MGGGFTYLIMPQFFAAFVAAGLSQTLAWKISLIVPFIICFSIALVTYFLSTVSTLHSTTTLIDEQNNDPKATVTLCEVNDSESAGSVINTTDTYAMVDKKGIPAIGDRSFTDVVKGLLTAMLNPAVLILMLHYACCFGIELAIGKYNFIKDNIIGEYFLSHFKIDNCFPSIENNQCSLLSIKNAGKFHVN